MTTTKKVHSGAQKPNGNGNDNDKERKPQVPFQRVKVDEVTYVDDRLKSNAFVTKVRSDKNSLRI